MSFFAKRIHRMRPALIFGVFLAVILSFTAACGSQESADKGAKGSSLKVALLATQKFGDKGPMDDMRNELKKASKKYGVKVQFVEAGDPAGYADDLRTLAQSGLDLIIAPFNNIAEPMHKVAAEFPKVKFSQIFGDPVPKSSQNIRSITFDFYHGTYLAGIAAGLLTKSNQVGFIAGENIPVMNVDYNAFAAGAKSVNPTVKTKIAYANGFEDPAGGNSVALLMYSQGVDVISTDAAETGSGVNAAAKKTDKLVIGDSSDRSFEAPKNYISSVVLRFGQVAYDQVQALVEGKWQPGDADAGLAEGVISLLPFDKFAKSGDPSYTKKLPDVEKAIQKATAAIKDGSLKVPHNDSIG